MNLIKDNEWATEALIDLKCGIILNMFLSKHEHLKLFVDMTEEDLPNYMNILETLFKA